MWFLGLNWIFCCILYHTIQWPIQDFPKGGADPVGGRQGPTWQCSGKLVCKKERIWSLGGRRRRPLDQPMQLEWNLYSLWGPNCQGLKNDPSECLEGFLRFSKRYLLIVSKSKTMSSYFPWYVCIALKIRALVALCGLYSINKIV